MPTLVWPGGHSWAPAPTHPLPVQTWPAGHVCGAVSCGAVGSGALAGGFGGDTQEPSLPDICPGGHGGQGSSLQNLRGGSGGSGLGVGSLHGPFSQTLPFRSGGFDLRSFASFVPAATANGLVSLLTFGFVGADAGRLTSDTGVRRGSSRRCSSCTAEWEAAELAFALGAAGRSP